MRILTDFRDDFEKNLPGTKIVDDGDLLGSDLPAGLGDDEKLWPPKWSSLLIHRQHELLVW